MALEPCAGTDAVPISRIDHITLAQPFDAFDEAGLFYRSVLDLRPGDSSELAAPGGLRWERTDLVDVQTPAVVGDVVYVTDETNLIALNGAGGEELWTAADWNAASGGERANAGGPVVVGGRI